jgi:hypothetical protein
MSVTAGSEFWRAGYYVGARDAADNKVEKFGREQRRALWSDWSAGWLAGWLDYQEMGHDRLRAVGHAVFDAGDVVIPTVTGENVDLIIYGEEEVTVRIGEEE